MNADFYENIIESLDMETIYENRRELERYFANCTLVGEKSAAIEVDGVYYEIDSDSGKILCTGLNNFYQFKHLIVYADIIFSYQKIHNRKLRTVTDFCGVEYLILPFVVSTYGIRGAELRMIYAPKLEFVSDSMCEGCKSLEYINFPVATRYDKGAFKNTALKYAFSDKLIRVKKEALYNTKIAGRMLINSEQNQSIMTNGNFVEMDGKLALREDIVITHIEELRNILIQLRCEYKYKEGLIYSGVEYRLTNSFRVVLVSILDVERYKQSVLVFDFAELLAEGSIPFDLQVEVLIFPNVQSIGSSVFSHNNFIKKIIAEQATAISSQSVKGCKNLVSVEIPRVNNKEFIDGSFKPLLKNASE